MLYCKASFIVIKHTFCNAQRFLPEMDQLFSMKVVPFLLFVEQNSFTAECSLNGTVGTINYSILQSVARLIVVISRNRTTFDDPGNTMDTAGASVKTNAIMQSDLDRTPTRDFLLKKIGKKFVF